MKAKYKATPHLHLCDCGKTAVKFDNGWVCSRCKSIEEDMYAKKGGKASMTTTECFERARRNKLLLGMEPYRLHGISI